MLNLAAGITRLRTEGAFEVLDRAKRLQAEGRSIINLGIGQPDFPTPPHIIEAAVKALRDGRHGYTSASGIPALREAVARDLHHRHGVEIDPDMILIVPGGKVTMFFAALMFGEPKTEILYPDPGFPIYESIIAYAGATPVAIPLREADGFTFSAEAVLSRITPKTRLVILNSPANPTGGVTPRAEIDRLVAGLERHPHVALLSDEIYSRMLFDGAEHASLLRYPSIRDRVILLDGWSKTYAMTGWRLGYGVWPRGLIEYATRLAINCHSCVNTAAQYAGIAALDGPQDCVRKMVTAFDQRRRLVIQRLNAIPALSCITPGGAFYAFPNVTRTGLSTKEVEVALLEQGGVATVAGTSFGRCGEGYLRLSYANSMENIVEAITRISDLLARRNY